MVNQGGLAAGPGTEFNDCPSKEIWPSETKYEFVANKYGGHRGKCDKGRVLGLLKVSVTSFLRYDPQKVKRIK